MPFKSKAQRRWMHATNPKMAARWEAEQSKSSKKRLPARAKRKKKR